jgi:hypothetical protein
MAASTEALEVTSSSSFRMDGSSSGRYESVESFRAVLTRRWCLEAISFERAWPMPEEQPVTWIY